MKAEDKEIEGGEVHSMGLRCKPFFDSIRLAKEKS